MSTKTQHYDLPIPDNTPEAAQSGYAALLAIRNALIAIDGLIHGQAGAIAGKAANDKTWQMADIDGLAAALAGKMAAGKTFALGELTDTAGIADALVGYVLARMPDGKWSPASAQSVIGPHEHLVSEIQGLADALADRPLASAVAAALASRLPRDGSAAMTGDLDMGGNKLLNVDWSDAVGTTAGTLAAGDDPRLIDDPLSFAAQSLTPSQQAQVRENLDVARAGVRIPAIATTSGTAFDWMTIDPGATEITLDLSDVGLSGTDVIIVQLGTADGLVTTGYNQVLSSVVSGSYGFVSSVAGFSVGGGAANRLGNGTLRLRRLDGSDIWAASYAGGRSDPNVSLHGGGSVSLDAPVTQVRLTRSGTNAFVSGMAGLEYRT